VGASRQEAGAALLTTQQGLSLGVGGEVGSSGCDHFRGFEGNSSSDGRDSDGSGGSHHSGGGVDKRSSGGRGADGKVSGGDTEAVDGVRDIAGALHKAVSVDVGVTSAGDAVGGTGLGLGARATRVAVAVLSQGVLSVVLAGYRGSDTHRGSDAHRGSDTHRGSDAHRGGCIRQGTQEARFRGGQSHQAGDDHLQNTNN
jgi:hypothetical protein